MKNFAEYSVEDFATEPLFIQWVQQPHDAELSNFWLKNHPDKLYEISQAKTIVNHVSGIYEDLDQAEVMSLWRRIAKSVDTFSTLNTTPFSYFSVLPWLAFLLIIIGIGWYVFH
jgi:hypothetical protein